MAKGKSGLRSDANPDMVCSETIEWVPCLTYVILYVLLDVLIASEGRTNPVTNKREYAYIPGVLVMLSEAGKLLITMSLLALGYGLDAPRTTQQDYEALDNQNGIKRNAWLPFWPLGAMYAVPAALYTLWNLINYQSLLLVPLSVYSVIYQCVLFFSAGFWCIVFKRSLTMMQWFSLILLAAGVFVVHVKPNFEFDIHLSALWVLLQAFISAVASVANEWLYKDPDQKHANINQQNAWLYLWGTIFTAIFITATQGPSVFLPDNFFKGFSARVVIIIFVSIALGLSVSLILKHCNVIIKLYAQAIHSPLEVVTAHLALGTELSFMIIVASFLIAVSTVMYYLGRHMPPAEPAKAVEETPSGAAPPLVETPDIDDADQPKKGQVN